MATWSTQLNTLEQRAAEHDKFGQLLITNVADNLRGLATRYEELRKAHVDFAGKLDKERDSSYSDLRKMKGKYDTVCQEVENKRKRNDGGQKSQIAFQQQLSEMHNVKVLSIGIIIWEEELKCVAEYLHYFN
jgi:formin-binding protein 1